MNRLDAGNPLVVAVPARVIVGPGDQFCILIVADLARFVRVDVSCVKEVCPPEAAQVAQRRSQILMVASRQNTSASLAETGNALTVFHSQAMTCVNRE